MLKLSKLKKGDKLHVIHDNKELVITITHIEMEKGTPTVNFKCNGDEDIRIVTEFKTKAKKIIVPVNCTARTRVEAGQKEVV